MYSFTFYCELMLSIQVLYEKCENLDTPHAHLNYICPTHQETQQLIIGMNMYIWYTFKNFSLPRSLLKPYQYKINIILTWVFVKRILQ